MVYRVSTKISADKFKKMISMNRRGETKFIPRANTAALRKAGKGYLLHKNALSKKEATDAIKYLIEEGIISVPKSPSKLIRLAAREQYKEEQKEKEEEEEKQQAKKEKEEEEEGARQQERFKLYRKQEDEEDEEKEFASSRTGGKSRLGDDFLDQIRREGEKKEEEKNKRQGNNKQSNSPKKAGTQTIKPIDIQELPDMNKVDDLHID